MPSPCTTIKTSEVAFSTNSPAVNLTVAGSACLAELAPGQVLTQDTFVNTSTPGPIVGAKLFGWTVAELTGVIGFGISDGTEGGLIRDGVVNLYYLSDGRIIKDGEIVAVAPSFGAGDTVNLYLDAEARVGCFLLNKTVVWS